MDKFQRKYQQFKRTAGWNLKEGKPAPLYVTAADKRHIQSKIRTMSDAEVDRLLK